MPKSKEKTRKRLSQYHTFDHAVELLKNAKNIVVLTGAGISTSLDIPDFRSAGGFYKEFFSLDFFKAQSESFWDNVKPLLPQYVQAKDGTYQYVAGKYSDKNSSVPRFSKTHAFLSLLHSNDKLLTNYTQNIDNLEFAAGVRADKIVKCHGSWDTATCLSCRKTISARKYLPIVWESGYPRCSCAGKDIPKKKIPKTKPKKRKRAIYEGDSDHDSDDGTTMPRGLFKPDITFFGEGLPQYYVPRLEQDKVNADLVLVMGTSLKVRPVRTMVVDFPPHIPQLWINKTRFNGYESDMPGVSFDIELIGECDVVVEELCKRAGLPLHKFTWIGDREGENKTSATRIRDTTPTEHSRLAEVTYNKDESDVLTKLTVRDKADDYPAVTSVSGPLLAVSRAEAGSVSASSSASSTKLSSIFDQPERPDIRIEADLDAAWRWRFTKKRTLSTNSSVTGL
ncbi:NAD-dependent histone deacetylase sir2 [Lithohypha guttulata]|uniref:NAD-dependent histone deacetylase sir2 n=1 Tax=Lithohypha guttulata TaxID=1690604 RepID=UPI002DE116B5|nr:NAD-dependent histone deacetylase sir2 [Lithohypha guttulata]